MAYISKRNRTAEKERQEAAQNRREIIAAGLNRREMLKMGLLTSAGLLVAKKGVSARALNSAGHSKFVFAHRISQSSKAKRPAREKAAGSLALVSLTAAFLLPRAGI